MEVDQLEEILKENLERRTKSNSNPQRTLQKQFAMLDLNRDKEVDLEEFCKAVEPFLHGAKVEDITELFHRWDMDQSGKVDSNEFVQALFLPREERQKRCESRANRRKLQVKSSIKAKDILEQAKRNRLKREMKARKLDTEIGYDSDEEELDLEKFREGYEHKHYDVQTGPFGRGGRGEREIRVKSMPHKLRYRVSKTWVPAQPSSSVTAMDVHNSARLPEEKLQLEYAYGINSSCGMCALDKGKLAYATAGVGVIYDPAKHEQRFYLGHDDDITCITVDPTLTLCATGQMGKIPTVHVWKVDSLETVCVLGKSVLERSVCAIAFSHDSKWLAAVGCDNHHQLAIWDISRGARVNPALVATAACQNGKPPQISFLMFNPENREEFITCGKKHTRFWRKDEDGRFKSKSGTFSQRTSALDLSAPKEMLCGEYITRNTALTGGSNGCLYLWNCEDRSCLSMIHAHRGPANGIVVADNLMVLSCGDDDNVVFWKYDSKSLSLTKVQALNLPESSSIVQSKSKASKNTNKSQRVKICALSENRGIAAVALLRRKSQRKKELPVVFVATGARQLHCLCDRNWSLLVAGHYKDLYGLGVHPTESGAFVTVGEDKLVHIWDGETRQVIRTFKLFGKCRSVDVSPNGKEVAIGMHSGSFVVLNVSSGKLVTERKFCEETIDDLKYSPNGKTLAVGSHDNFVDLYDVDKSYTHYARCKGHTSFVTHLDWSACSRIIRSNCGSYEIMYWDARSGKNIVQVEVLRDVEWQTQSCVLGFEVMGIWPSGADGTDVNAVSRSPNQRLLCSGDDRGNVRLFNYPCLVDHAPSRSYGGHSSHVMNVRWLADGKRLVSVGGCDKTVFQWKLVRSRGDNQAERSTLIQASKAWQPSSSWR